MNSNSKIEAVLCLRRLSDALDRRRRGAQAPLIAVFEFSEATSLIEQDHRNIKSRVTVMLGFKQFKNAAITIAGIELMHRIRKGQFNLAARVKQVTAPAVWNAVLSA